MLDVSEKSKSVAHFEKKRNGSQSPTHRFENARHGGLATPYAQAVQQRLFLEGVVHQPWTDQTVALVQYPLRNGHLARTYWKNAPPEGKGLLLECVSPPDTTVLNRQVNFLEDVPAVHIWQPG